jgi:hypothetical protein
MQLSVGSRHIEMKKNLRAIIAISVLAYVFPFPVMAESEESAIRTSELRSDVGGHIDLLGGLGKPLGTFTMIEGIRAKSQPGSKVIGPTTLLIQKIDGEEIEKEQYVRLSNVSELPQDTTIVVKGYETGGYTGVPRNVSEESHLGSQKLWSFSTHFIVVVIVEPKEVVPEIRTVV